MFSTVVVSVSVWLPGLGSPVVDATATVFDTMAPCAVPKPILAVSVKTAEPTATDPAEHDTVPPAPTAGVVHDQPPGAESDRNVVPLGRVSMTETFAAASGPALTTVIV